MKTAVIIFVLFVAYVATKDESPMEITMNTALDKCKKSMNVSEEILELVMTDEGNNKTEVQCFGACFAKEAGLVTDGKLDMNKVESFIQSGKEDKDSVQEGIKVMKECKKIAENSTAEILSDECKVAGVYLKCMKAKFPK